MGIHLVKGKNDFASWCEQNNKEYLLEEWDYERNGSHTPDNVMYGSTYKAWWLCKAHKHSYQVEMYHRTQKKSQDCPICSNRQILVGYNDLLSTHPNLAKEWHPTKNGKLKPTDVSWGSMKKVWWMLGYDVPNDYYVVNLRGKHFDFEWQAIINNRASKGSGCPFLAGTLWKGFNDLQTVNPQLAKEWHPTKNGDLHPTDVVANKNIRVWWKCSKCQFEWQTGINNRNSGDSGCPYCGRIKQARNYRINHISSHKSLAENNPELAKEWHPTKNGNLTPKDVSSGCSDKVWWLLPYDDPITGKHFDFEWRASIASRNSGIGCPFLFGKCWSGFNDISVTNPEVAKHWNYEKNSLKPTEVTKGTHKKVWWNGDCGHTFLSSVAIQCRNGISCPICAKEQQTSFPEQAVLYYIRQVFPDAVNGDRISLDGFELDIYIPSLKVGIEYDGSAWHKNTDKDLNKELKCKEKGISLIRIREEDCENYNDNSYLTYKYKYGDWDALDKIIKRICNRFSNKPIDISIKRDVHKIEEMYLADKRDNSVAISNPELLSLWHPTKNANLSLYHFNRGSEKIVWWRDEYGHEFECAIKQMALGGTHCPYCNNFLVLKGFNDLLTKNPEMAKEWDYEKNTETPDNVIYKKAKKYWFICSTCGHNWQAYLSNRIVHGTGCPVCGRIKQRKARIENSQKQNYGKPLSITHPELVSEWDENLNGISADQVIGFSKSTVKYWWRCKECNRKWQSTIKNRVHGRGCSFCRRDHQKKKILNIDTNQVFNSVKEASEFYHCNSASITNCCKGRQNTSQGYHWKYVE